MKLLATIASLAVLSRADDDGEIDPKKFSHIVDMINSQITTSLSSDVIVKRIQNYGCHCFPGMTRAAGGQGSPVDALDSQCQALYRCHRCVNMDFPGQCDVNAGKYRFSISNGVITCETNRNSPCQINQCECDKEFATNFGSMWDDSSFNFHYWLNRNNVRDQDAAGTPTFDYASACVNAQNNVSPDQCCGNTAIRRPYSSTVYDCCTDGTLKSLGSC